MQGGSDPFMEGSIADGVVDFSYLCMRDSVPAAIGHKIYYILHVSAIDNTDFT